MGLAPSPAGEGEPSVSITCFLAYLLPMKAVLLQLVLTTPAFALAQIVPKAPLQGSINPHGFFLANKAVLYRQLHDTLSSRGRQLRPGNTIVLERQYTYPYPRYLKVVRGNSNGTSYSRDTTSYFLPASALKGARTFVLI